MTEGLPASGRARKVRRDMPADAGKRRVDLPGRGRAATRTDGHDDRVSASDQATAMSPRASPPLLPVLSPILQVLGKPARRRLAPVRHPSSHSVRVRRDRSDSTSPRTRRRNVLAMADGVVVSWVSPGVRKFKASSKSSSRVVSSPIRRQNAVSAEGPPMRDGRRLARDSRRLARDSRRSALVLSLFSTAAAHISPTVSDPFARLALATGACQSGTSTMP